MTIHTKRNYPIGSEILSKRGVHFRVWVPKHKSVDVVLEDGDNPEFFPMKREKGGYFSVFVKQAKEGSLYRFRLSRGKKWYPDPASRYQPQGPSGPSCVVSSIYPWRDKKWKGIYAHGHIAYEMHIGTFTEKGTFLSAMEELPRLAKLGITLIEIMPINDFPGHFGWGYDGVNLFAPTHLYGSPKDVKAFVDKAHSLQIGVVLDVVYNHLGPEANSMIEFSSDYLSEKFLTDWGKAMNFDCPQSREFFLTNATYWIEEFHFDGLRIDATPSINSLTPMHFLQELTMTVKKAGGRRKTIVIGENESQDSQLLQTYQQGGYGFDMLWSDDFHHSAIVRLTGKREAYYFDYLGSPQEFISLFKYGYLFQGQYYAWQKKSRGKPSLDIPHHAFMIYLENHDQVANSGYGLRLHKRTDPGNYRAMLALFLLSPNTPLIFQGQEFNSNSPFYYFSDHSPFFSPSIGKGRKEELAQFPRLATKDVRKIIPSPENPRTFIDSKLNEKDLKESSQICQLFTDLIHLRKNDSVFKHLHTLSLDGAVLGTDCFLIRYFCKDEDRIILVNFGPDYYFNPCPEPLLAPYLGDNYEIIWSSEAVKYGGEGTPPIAIPSWKILGHSAIVLKTKRVS